MNSMRFAIPAFILLTGIIFPVSGYNEHNQGSPSRLFFGMDGYSWRAMDNSANEESLKTGVVIGIAEGLYRAHEVQPQDTLEEKEDGLYHWAIAVQVNVGDLVADIDRFYGDSGNRHLAVVDAFILVVAQEYSPSKVPEWREKAETHYLWRKNPT